MIEDDEAPRRRKIAHEIGQKIDDLSVADFDERIALLQIEIERLEVGKRQKQAALSDAGSIFRR